MADQASDERFMAAAIRLSRRHSGLTATNPSVGCLIVRDGAIIAASVTAIFGRPHAETQALYMAGEKTEGATAYVTLEPCSHHGATPPCANALVAAGIRRVVVSQTDPDLRVAGSGLEILRNNGIDVTIGVLKDESRRALAGYLTRQRLHRPHVTLKLAASIDGMIGRNGGGQVAITGALSRRQSHAMRAESDAILVGIGTALADDPELTCRLPGLEHRSPLAIILDGSLQLKTDSKLVQAISSHSRRPLLVITSLGAGFGRRQVLENAGVEVLALGTDYLADLCAILGGRGVSSLIVEGGGTVANAFLDQDLVDRIVLFTGPDAIGADGIRSPLDRHKIPAGFTLIRRDRFGLDFCEEFERN